MSLILGPGEPLIPNYKKPPDGHQQFVDSLLWGVSYLTREVARQRMLRFRATSGLVKYEASAFPHLGGQSDLV
jgi:hypothetical protein